MFEWILLAANQLPLVKCARSEVFFTEESVASIIFPGLSFQKKDYPLTPDQISIIESKSGETVREKTVHTYRTPSGEMIIIDRVLGKHEFITYAVGMKKDGSIKQIEILEYKESYGDDVKKESWRNQFVNKTKVSKLKLKEDIQNISGATLSSLHLTNGTRRVLQTYELIREKS